MCPQCGSESVIARSFDFGVCSQTGYHDAGEAFECRECGATGDASEIDAMLRDAGLTPAERDAWRRLTRKPAGRESAIPSLMMARR